MTQTTEIPWWLRTGDARREGVNEILAEAWHNRSGPAVLATRSEDGVPNVVYTRFIKRYDDKTFVIADHFLTKTYDNILAGSSGALLFLTRDGVSYQVKGALTYHQDGELFLDMRRWNPPELPRRATVALHLEEVYKGAERLY
jgi:hypothetical protein